jgi:hypothetical protein
MRCVPAVTASMATCLPVAVPTGARWLVGWSSLPTGMTSVESARLAACPQPQPLLSVPRPTMSCPHMHIQGGVTTRPTASQISHYL